MNQLFTSWPRRLLALVVSLVMATGLLGPSASLAGVNRSLNGGGGVIGDGEREGDPLDSNDHSGSGSDDDIHNDSIDRGGISLPLIPALADGRRILLIPDFQSGTLVFRILIVEAETIGSEE